MSKFTPLFVISLDELRKGIRYGAEYFARETAERCNTENLPYMEYEYDNDLKYKYAPYFLAFGALGFVIMLAILVITDDYEQYTLITKETEVIGRVSSVERNHGYLRFKVNDSLKYTVRGSNMNNYEYSEPSFFFFLNDYDWIDKRKGTDTLLIEKQFAAHRNEYYQFVIGQDLNKELRKE
ncbi:MAG: hypothetical protein HOP30_03450 [Cyclobacteriaceae bacterium]|nr:hypothetical protein [Cyclobacteriaceae bacterium]